MPSPEPMRVSAIQAFREELARHETEGVLALDTSKHRRAGGYADRIHQPPPGTGRPLWPERGYPDLWNRMAGPWYVEFITPEEHPCLESRIF